MSKKFLKIQLGNGVEDKQSQDQPKQEKECYGLYSDAGEVFLNKEQIAYFHINEKQIRIQLAVADQARPSSLDLHFAEQGSEYQRIKYELNKMAGIKEKPKKDVKKTKVKSEKKQEKNSPAIETIA